MKTFIISLALCATVVLGKKTCEMNTQEILDEGLNQLQECYKEYNITSYEISEDSFKHEKCSTFCFLRSAKIMEHSGALNTDVLKDVAFPEDKLKSVKVVCDPKFDDDSKAQKSYPCDYTNCLVEQGFFEELDKIDDVDNYLQKNFRKDCN